MSDKPHSQNKATAPEPAAKPEVRVKCVEAKPLLQRGEIERSLLSGYDDRW